LEGFVLLSLNAQSAVWGVHTFVYSRVELISFVLMQRFDRV